MFGDVQDFEFTVEGGRLYLLQTRGTKRTPWAAVKIATGLDTEGLLQTKQALGRLKDIDLETLVRSRLSGTQNTPIARATAAGIGAVAGRIALEQTRRSESVATANP